MPHAIIAGKTNTEA